MESGLLEYPMRDWILGGIIIVAFPMLIQFGSSLLLVKFVGLQSPPLRRAILTTAIAYALSVIAGISMAPTEYVLWVPLVCAPATLFVYFYWKRIFVRAWYEDASLIPEGMTLANEDWRIGLYALVAAIALAFIQKAPVILSVRQASGH